MIRFSVHGAYWTILAIGISLIGFSSLYAQEEKKDIVIVDHADSLIGLEINGESARQLIGNVKLTHGKTVVTCNRAIQFRQSNKVSLQGDVIVKDDSMTLFTQNGMYYGNERIAEAFDGVRVEERTSTVRAKYGKYYTSERRANFKNEVSVEDSASRLTSNELVYFRDSQKTIADGNVKIVNRENRITIFGEHFENNKSREYSIMTVNPLAIQLDTAGVDKFDTLYIRSDTMKSYRQNVEELITSGNVSLKRSGFLSESGLTIFYTKLDSIKMNISPVVWYEQNPKETTQVTGDSIFVKLEKRKLKRMNVRGNSLAVSQVDSVHRGRYHQMSGQDMVILFDSNTVRQIDIDKTVTLLYYTFDGDEPNGLNKTTGDHGTMTFFDKKIDRVKVTGGVEGQYYPEKMVKGKEIDYNITAFDWRTPRRSKKTVIN
ncbi:MAG: OstA-like protein [Bacteroidota bacterium]